MFLSFYVFVSFFISFCLSFFVSFFLLLFAYFCSFLFVFNSNFRSYCFCSYEVFCFALFLYLIEKLLTNCYLTMMCKSLCFISFSFSPLEVIYFILSIFLNDSLFIRLCVCSNFLSLFFIPVSTISADRKFWIGLYLILLPFTMVCGFCGIFSIWKHSDFIKNYLIQFSLLLVSLSVTYWKKRYFYFLKSLEFFLGWRQKIMIV